MACEPKERRQLEMTTGNHIYKGGRLRPENAARKGEARRGYCLACGQPKAAHNQFR